MCFAFMVIFQRLLIKCNFAEDCCIFKNVAEKAAGINQPEMNFSRINRMRESAKRQKELRQRDQRVRQQMAEAEGAKKMQR